MKNKFLFFITFGFLFFFCIQTNRKNSFVLKDKIAHLSQTRFEKMQNAYTEIQACYELLNQKNSSVIKEVTQGQNIIVPKTRYPNFNTYDEATQNSYFFHSHRRGETGHFHLFYFKDEENYFHIVAISVDRKGFPVGLFITNDWVTGENQIGSIKRLDQFKITHPYPSELLNRWINAMVELFYPQIAYLIDVKKSPGMIPGRNREILYYLPISISDQAKELSFRSHNFF